MTFPPPPLYLSRPADADGEELDRFFEALEAMDDKGWSQPADLAEPETRWRGEWAGAGC